MAQTNLFNEFYDSGSLYYDTADIEERLEDIAGNLANMLLINAAGGVKLWDIPFPEDSEEFEDCHWHNSGSPIIFKSTCVFFAVGDWSTIPTGAVTFEFTISGTNYKAYISPDSTGEVELPIYRQNETTPAVTLKATEYKGVATFDVSSIVNAWYVPMYALVASSEKYVKADDVSVQFRVKDLFISGEYTTYVCVRGVNAPNIYNDGYNSDDPVALTHTRKFYTQPAGVYPVLRNWVTILFGDGATYTNGQETKHFNRGEVWHFAPEMWDWVSQKAYITLSQTASTCYSRFFVRWLNQDGGLESFMFTQRQVYERTAKTANSKGGYNDYSDPDRQKDIPYNLEHARSVTCGAEQLTKAELELLETMAVSSYIVTAFNTYHLTRLSVKDYKGKRDTKGDTYSFEITFNLPDEVFEF